jgi:uncharacterized protein (TIGR02145 family)
MREILKLLLIILIILVLAIFSCEELEPTNPADPSFTLKAPTLITAQAISDIRIDLTWQNNEEHTKEFVVKRKSGSESYSIIGTATENNLTFTDTACVLGTEYSYVVQSKVESNESANSNALKKATTFPGPSNLDVIAVTDESVRLTWTDNTTYESGFKIERDAGSGFTEIATVSADVTEYTDSGLTFGQDYSYRVAAYTSSNTSSWTTITSATEFPAPSDLSATAISDSEVQLAWVDNTSYETGFKIERDDGSGFTEIGTVSSDVTEYTDSGLTVDQTYSYRVAAYTSGNTSSWETITATTEFPAPTNLSATAISDSEIELTWTDNTGYELGFRIERNGGSGFVELGVVSSDVTEFPDIGLTVGQSYDYRVAAYTWENTSSWVSITTTTEFPAPTNLSAIAISDSEIELTWADNTGYESGFKIECDDGSGFIEIGTVSPNVTEYTDSGLSLGQTYSYRVAAYSSVNTSSWATTTADTEFPAPTNLSATAISDSEIELTWTDDTSYEAGFRIERDDGSGFTEVGTVSSNVTEYTDDGLDFGKDYSYRVAGYTTLNQSPFSVSAAAITNVVDIDDNIYKVIRIGDQVWMAENLKVIHYRNGTAITHVTDNAAWVALTTEAYCIYNNNASNEVDTYGVLYNWYAAADARNIAPMGWHMPTDAEWTELEAFLSNNGHVGVEGAALKSTTSWSSGGNGTDDYGFTALPSGYRDSGNHDYDEMGNRCFFWSVIEYDGGSAWNRLLNYDNSDIGRGNWGKRNGFAIRCLRD